MAGKKAGVTKAKVIGRVPKRGNTKPPRPPFLATARDAQKQAREAFEFDLNRRKSAQGSSNNPILSADDLGGMYALQRQLFTTIDGKPRIITLEDLRNFSAFARDIKKRSQKKGFRGGITPKMVIDLSAKDDRDRAHSEITMAAPIRHKGGTIHFQTNSGPNSKVARHHVYVQFMNFEAVVGSPAESEKMVNEMLRGPIRFDCDCGRHTFWYRYIATIGGYAYGRQEDGYPKIRNPRLRGVACKHVLRVMAMLLQSPHMKKFAADMIKAQRERLAPKDTIVAVRDAEKLVQQFRKESWRQRAVRTSEQKRRKPATKAQQAAAKATSQVRKTSEKAAQRRALARSLKNAQREFDKAKQRADEMLSQKYVTPSEHKRIIARATKTLNTALKEAGG